MRFMMNLKDVEWKALHGLAVREDRDWHHQAERLLRQALVREGVLAPDERDRSVEAPSSGASEGV